MDSNSVYCRFCAEIVTHSKEPLIDLSNIATLEHYKIIFTLINVKFIDLHSEHLPKTVCKPCSLCIEQTFLFFEKAKLAQDLLAKLFYVKDELKAEFDSNNDICTTEISPVKLENSIKNEVDETGNINELSCYEEFNYYSDSSDEISRNYDSDSNFEIKTTKSLKTHVLSKKRKCSAEPTKKKDKMQKLIQDSDSEQSVNENHTLTSSKVEEISKSAQHNNTLDRAVVTDIANASSSEDYSWTDYNWNCVSCIDKFSNMEELREHSKAIHNLCFGYKCKDCSDEFNIFGNFIEHVRLHIPNLRLHSREVHKECFTMKCADCFKVSNNFKTFVSHVQLHRTHLQNYCHYCDSYDEDQEKLKRHVELHSQSSCKTCGVILEDEELFDHINEYNVNIKAAKKSWPCKLCSKTFMRSQGLRAHLQVHRDRVKEYVCEHCGASFAVKHNMLAHRKLHSAKQAVCQICKKVFKNEANLKRHVQFLHLPTKKISCTECGKSCSNIRCLRAHMNVHSDVAKYKCEYCGKGFKRKKGLVTHLSQHTGVRPFSCKFCGRTFTSWGNCDKHMVIRHKSTLAKTKRTPGGVVALDETGNPLPLPAVEDAKEWIDGLFKKCVRKSKKLHHK